MGSPMVRFLCTFHGKLKSLAMMNLNILLTFMLCVALEKNSVASIAFAYALACKFNITFDHYYFRFNRNNINILISAISGQLLFIYVYITKIMASEIVLLYVYI